MFFDERGVVRILTVMECKWGAKNRPVRRRPFAALSIRLKGNAEITEGGKTEQMRTGDILYMPKGADYRLKCGNEHIIVIHFDTDGAADEHFSVFRLENSAPVRAAFDELLSAWCGKEQGYYARALSLFYKIIYELEKSTASPKNEKYDRIKEAVEYLHSSYTDPELTVSELCARAYMSDTYFRRIFSEIYSKKPLEYMNELRISHAAVLLQESASSVEEVAQLSGFSDVKYFSTVFKKRLGKSPTEYRKKMFL